MPIALRGPGSRQVSPSPLKEDKSYHRSLLGQLQRMTGKNHTEIEKNWLQYCGIVAVLVHLQRLHDCIENLHKGMGISCNCRVYLYLKYEIQICLPNYKDKEHDPDNKASAKQRNIKTDSSDLKAKSRIALMSTKFGRRRHHFLLLSCI